MILLLELNTVKGCRWGNYVMVCMCMRSGFGGCWPRDRCVGGGCGCSGGCGSVDERLVVTQVTVTTVSIHSQK